MIDLFLKVDLFMCSIWVFFVVYDMKDIISDNFVFDIFKVCWGVKG